MPKVLISTSWCGAAERNIEQRLPHQLVEIRTFGIQLQLEIPPLALGVFVHLVAHLAQCFGVALRRWVHLGRARRAQIKAHQGTLLVHPGGEGAERRFNRVPIMFHGAACSLRLVQRCMVARLRWGENFSINLPVSAWSGRSFSLCSRCSAVASALSPTGEAS